MKTLLNRLHSLTGRDHNATPVPLAICGIGYEHYRVISTLADSRQYAVIALFDDCPWNHAVQVKGVSVYYPVEAPSLIKRHDIKAVIYCQQGDLSIFDEQTFSALTDQHIEFVCLDPGEDMIATLTHHLPTL